MTVRIAQLALRHEEALDNAIEHSYRYANNPIISKIRGESKVEDNKVEDNRRIL